MNAFNRLVVILLTVLAIFVVIILILVPGLVLSIMVATLQWVYQIVQQYGAGSDWALFTAGRVVIGGALVVLFLILLWLELRRPRKTVIRAQKLTGGEATITVDSIAQRVAWHIDQLSDVVRVVPRITGRGKGVDVDLMLETAPEIDVPMKTDEVMQVTKDVVEDRMGLKLGKVTINIKHAPYPEA
jgi:type III secretion system FlhB-like substrate exporter